MYLKSKVSLETLVSHTLEKSTVSTSRMTRSCVPSFSLSICELLWTSSLIGHSTWDQCEGKSGWKAIYMLFRRLANLSWCNLERSNLWDVGCRLSQNLCIQYLASCPAFAALNCLKISNTKITAKIFPRNNRADHYCRQITWKRSTGHTVKVMALCGRLKTGLCII